MSDESCRGQDRANESNRTHRTKLTAHFNYFNIAYTMRVSALFILGAAAAVLGSPVPDVSVESTNLSEMLTEHR